MWANAWADEAGGGDEDEVEAEGDECFFRSSRLMKEEEEREDCRTDTRQSQRPCGINRFVGQRKQWELSMVVDGALIMTTKQPES